MLDQTTPVSHTEAPARPVKKRGTCFRNIAYIVMLYMYFGMMGILLRPHFHPLTFYGGSMTIGFNVIFLLLFISFVRSSKTDPGVVPVNWGFYMGDDTKRRRYCKVCNVWKPDRTHHCSACNRCVLNMDHHCPWIDNCVGFYNRKYFMQLLVYAVLGLLFTVFHSICFLINETFMEVPPVGEIYPDASDMGFKAASYIYVCVMIFVGLGLIFALIPFVQFHFRLVLKNSTTIENMDEASRDSGIYDMGIGANLQQVFGVNPLCWFAPCNLPLNRPVGDGVRWSQYYYTNIPNEP